MKKILSIIFLSIILASCSNEMKIISVPDDTENKYYFEKVPKEWTLPDMMGATSFEILKQKDCGVNEKFDSQNNKIVMQSYDCLASIDDTRLYRIIRDGMTEFYELDTQVIKNENGSMREEDFWKLSDNTF